MRDLWIRYVTVIVVCGSLFCCDSNDNNPNNSGGYDTELSTDSQTGPDGGGDGGEGNDINVGGVGDIGGTDTDVTTDDVNLADGGLDTTATKEDAPKAVDSDTERCGDVCDSPDLFTLDAVEAQTDMGTADGWVVDMTDITLGDGGGSTDTTEGPNDAGVDLPDTAALTVAELLVGRWEMVGIKDSGNPFEPVPPGAQFFIFTKENTAKMACDNPNGAPYTLVQNDKFIEVQFSPGSSILWAILQLDAENFVFYEGGDEFYLKRRKPCP